MFAGGVGDLSGVLMSRGGKSKEGGVSGSIICGGVFR